MKAIIMSHENGGSYCIDSTGSFHFVKGYENVDIGTEITISIKKPSHVRKMCIAGIAVLIVAAIAGFSCVRITSPLRFGAFGGEAAYARLCMCDSLEYSRSYRGFARSCRCY